MDRWADRLKYRSFSEGDLAAGQYLRDWFEEHDGNVLVESTGSYKFLNILVGSNAPERTVLSTGDDIQMVSLHIGQTDYLRENEPEIFQSYTAPKYGLASGGDLQMLATREIKLVFIESEEIVRTLNQSSNFKLTAEFGEWTMYRLTP